MRVLVAEDEKALDIAHLRRDTGCLTLDEGYRNTASVRSAITYIDGERGVLRYRGIPGGRGNVTTAKLVDWNIGAGDFPCRPPSTLDRKAH